MHRVKRFGVIQTANMFGALYFVIGVVAAILMAPFMFMAGSAMQGLEGLEGLEGGQSMWPFSGAVLFFMPLFYAFAGWITTAVGCVIYNVIGSFVGGISVELEPE